MKPGRTCPLHYRYAPSALAREPDLIADTLYVVGGLYGNRPALDAVLQLAERERGPVTLAFNGDFNWFNTDATGFASVNEEVLKHAALRGNVETELAGENEAAGCGCGYPEWVSEAEVERSNQIITHLRGTARRFPALRARLAELPMHLVAAVGGVRIAIVHGDAQSLAGWEYSQEALADPENRARVAMHFARSQTRVIASSHTCLPVAVDIDTAAGRCLLINNGAAGMPNFRNTRYGVITRIALTPTHGAGRLYGSRIDHLHVDSLALPYDHARWKREFLANWPVGSPAHTSYYQRIVEGPSYTLPQAVPAERCQRVSPRSQASPSLKHP